MLLVTGSFPPGRCGVGDYSYNLAKALCSDPETVVGVLTSTSCESEVLPTGIELFPIVESWRLTEAMKIIRLIRSWSPEVIHIQFPTQGYGDGLLPYLLPMISLLMGKEVVQTWHESYGRTGVQKLLLKALVPSGLVVVRPQYRERLHPVLRWVLWKKKYKFIRGASNIQKIDLPEQEKVEIKKRYLKGQKRLIVFFGFLYRHKGVDLLFDIADPTSDHIVIAGEIGDSDDYYQQLASRACDDPWRGKVTITGFLPHDEAAALLAAADAVVLPFRSGGGEWNTTIHAAVLQGTFVLATSLTQRKYDELENVYYAGPDNLAEMRSALDNYAGRRRRYSADIDRDEWQRIAIEHRSLYREISAHPRAGLQR